MTATTTGRTTATTGRVSFGNLLQSEWTKIRTVRSTVWSLCLLVALFLGLTALLVSLTVSTWNDTDAETRTLITDDPVAVILGSGFLIAQLAVCVLGVMVIASEYSTGMIRASLLAVPNRTSMLASKAVVLFVVCLVVGLIAAFGSFFIGAPILEEKAPVALGDPGVLRAVVGTALYLAVLAVFALAVGAIVRQTAAGITGVIGFVLVLAPLVQLIPGKAGEYAHAYLPTEAGILIGQAKQGSDDLLSPWQGFGVMCLWTIALLLLASYLLKRRDA